MRIDISEQSLNWLGLLESWTGLNWSVERRGDRVYLMR